MGTYLFILFQYSVTEPFTSLCNNKIPIKFGKVINATVTPEKVQTIVVSVNEAKKKPAT